MKRVSTVAALVLALLFAQTSRIYARHDIHISFGKATLTAETFEAKITIYKDDLLRALTTWHVGGYAGMNGAEFQQLELRYVANYFRVWENGSTQLTLRASQTKEDGGSITFDLLYSVSPDTRSITLDSRLLFKEYVDQTNVLVLDAFGQEINHVFTASSPSFVCARN